MDFLKLGICHVSIDLSGGDGRMSKHCLDGADISSVAQKVSGVGIMRNKTVSYKVTGFFNVKIVDLLRAYSG